MVLDTFAVVLEQWHGSLSWVAEAESQVTLVVVARWRGIVGPLPSTTIVVCKSGVKMVSCFGVEIALQSCGAWRLIGQNAEWDSLVLVTVIACHADVSDTNLFNVSGVKVILVGLPVLVNCKIR